MTDLFATFSQLSDELIIKEACVSLIGELEALRDSSYSKDAVTFAKDFHTLSQKYNDKLAPGFISKSSPVEILSYIDECLDYLMKIEPVELTLAFSPNKEFIRTLYFWLKDHLTFPFCIHFLVSEEVGGGVIVSFKGFYVDLSLKKAISDYFISNKDYVFAKL